MSAGAWALTATAAVVLAILAFLVFSMVRSMQDERTEGRSIWREFGLSIVLLVLFLASWIGQGVSQWQTFTDEERGAR